jgi:hypothetical protein
MIICAPLRVGWRAFELWGIGWQAGTVKDRRRVDLHA